MTRRSLLPPSSTKLERAIESVMGQDEVPAVHGLWNAYLIPAHLLPWLAWAVGVEDWDASWPEEQRRKAIDAQMQIALKRGTPWAVREAMRAGGYGEADIQEGLPPLLHNNQAIRNGTEQRGGANRWAMFKVLADLGEGQGVSLHSTARLVSLIDQAKPLRSVLYAVDYALTIADEANSTDTTTFSVDLEQQDICHAGVPRDGSIQRNATNARTDLDSLLEASAVATYTDTNTIEFKRNGQVERSGQARHASDGASCGDAMLITLTWAQRRNGRLLRTGNHKHKSSSTEQLAA